MFPVLLIAAVIGQYPTILCSGIEPTETHHISNVVTGDQQRYYVPVKLSDNCRVIIPVIDGYLPSISNRYVNFHLHVFLNYDPKVRKAWREDFHAQIRKHGAINYITPTQFTNSNRVKLPSRKMEPVQLEAIPKPVSPSLELIAPLTPLPKLPMFKPEITLPDDSVLRTIRPIPPIIADPRAHDVMLNWAEPESPKFVDPLEKLLRRPTEVE